MHFNRKTFLIILQPYKTKILRPVPKKEWRAPSAAQPKDRFGNESQVRFRVRAKLDDGHIVWRGWFDDREDFDAFLFAIASGNLHQQPALWHLPTPMWSPELDPHLTYDFATVTFLVSPTGSNQTFTSPSDWNNSNNIIELIAGGGSGAFAQLSRHGTGGGGGEYGKTTNFTFATPGTTTATYQIGAGGAAQASSGTNGNNGGDTWFNGTTQAGATLGAIHGNAGVVANGSQTGGSGGTGGVGTTHNAGGRGGNLTAAAGNPGGSGGGGAGGGTGAGNQGVDSAATSGSTNGGSGDAGSGGAAGTSPGGTAGNGTEWDASHGSGGGGGGNQTGGTGSGGPGGNYGGGGGGTSSTGAPTSGAGIQGIVVITYTPAASVFWPNAAMMGL